MYKEALIIALFCQVLSMGLGIIQNNMISTLSWEPENIYVESFILKSVQYLQFPVYFIIGLLSNKYYLMYMTKTINAIKKRGLADDEYVVAIEKAGGSNVKAVYCMIIIYSVYLGIEFYFIK